MQDQDSAREWDDEDGDAIEESGHERTISDDLIDPLLLRSNEADHIHAPRYRPRSSSHDSSGIRSPS
jgi:hypothetical protein